jgi:hypothetical protein
MLKIENHCCDCAVPGYPCRGPLCSYRNVEVYYCDVCREEIIGDIYEVEDKNYCEYCLKKTYKKD